MPTVDFKMQLSSVSEDRDRHVVRPAIEVTNTSASTTIQTEQLKNLPVNGRNFQDLVLLTPETRRDPESRGTVLVSGQRGINTNTTVDGLDYDNGFFGGSSVGTTFWRPRHSSNAGGGGAAQERLAGAGA